MKIEKQVCNLEFAKRLKELGVKQDSLFSWYQYRDSVYCEYREHQASRDAQSTYQDGYAKLPVESTYQDGYAKLPVEMCVAFTVAELGEMLPDWVDFTQKHYNSTTKRTWYRCYTKEGMMWIDEENEANARAKMLIYLIENGLVEVD